MKEHILGFVYFYFFIIFESFLTLPSDRQSFIYTHCYCGFVVCALCYPAKGEKQLWKQYKGEPDQRLCSRSRTSKRAGNKIN